MSDKKSKPEQTEMEKQNEVIPQMFTKENVEAIVNQATQQLQQQVSGYER